MQASLRLLAHRRFLPLFVTQFLGAFNDNLFKTAMILFATYVVFKDPQQESIFNAAATGLFILPFFLLSALSGQLADHIDKARIIRLVKAAEVLIMLVGAAGLLVCEHWPMTGVGLMLGAVLAMGVHSTFFGPIKYAILPQHLHEDQVLGGTGLVEAGTYIAILAGTIVAGWISPTATAVAVILVGTTGLSKSYTVSPTVNPSARACRPGEPLPWLMPTSMIVYPVIARTTSAKVAVYVAKPNLLGVPVAVTSLDAHQPGIAPGFQVCHVPTATAVPL